MHIEYLIFAGNVEGQSASMAEQSRGEKEGPKDEGAMSEGGNSGEEEDTWMVKIYKEIEQKSKEVVKDPAFEAGSRIFDLEASDPSVQRLLGLLQVCHRLLRVSVTEVHC